jgi:hypothetical protein
VSIEKPIRTVSFGPFFFMPPLFVCGPDTHALASASADMHPIKITLVRIEPDPFVFY